MPLSRARHLPTILALLALTGALSAGCGDRASAPGEAGPAGGGDDSVGTVATSLRTPPTRATAYRHSNVGPTAIRFVEISEASGITAVNHSGQAGVKEYLHEACGVGPAWFDYDNDGLMDVYVPEGDVFSNYVLGYEADPETGLEVPRLLPKAQKPERFYDQLYRNRGDGTFENVAERAGTIDDRWSYGATAVDYDADGWTDIYLCNFGENRLWHNNGDGTFTDVAPALRLQGQHWEWSNSAGVGDFDGDERLDFYVGNFLDTAFEMERVRQRQNLPVGHPAEAISGRLCRWRGIVAYCGPVGLKGQDDHLYLQQVDGRFRDVTEETGLVPRQGRYAFTVLVADWNEDGLLDAYLANDSVENFFWQQERPGGKVRFRDTSDILGVKYGQNTIPQASMGAAIADVNQDGLLDIFVTTFSHDYNNIYLGQRAPQGAFFFRDRGLQVMGQMVYYDLSWGCGWIDFDNDADLDLFVACGHVYKEIDLFEKTGAAYDMYDTLIECVDAKQMAYRMIGKKAQIDAPPHVNVEDLDAGPGMEVKLCSRGAGFCDFNNDGRMDILVQNMNEPPTVLLNVSRQGPDRNWVKILLRQEGGNRDALGAVVQVTAGGVTQTFPIYRVTSFIGTDDPRLHVGLGSATTCDVKVIWPGRGATTEYEGLEAGALWLLHRATETAERLPLPTFEVPVR